GVFFHQLGNFIIKYRDEFSADDLALRFRIGDSRQLAQESFTGINGDKIQPELFTQVLLDFSEFVFAKDAIIDEDAGEPRANGFVHQHGGDSGIHAARESADRVPFGTDGFLDRFDRFVDKARGGPVVLGAADAEDKIAQQVFAVLG